MWTVARWAVQSVVPMAGCWAATTADLTAVSLVDWLVAQLVEWTAARRAELTAATTAARRAVNLVGPMAVPWVARTAGWKAGKWAYSKAGPWAARRAETWDDCLVVLRVASSVVHLAGLKVEHLAVTTEPRMAAQKERCWAVRSAETKVA